MTDQTETNSIDDIFNRILNRDESALSASFVQNTEQLDQLPELDIASKTKLTKNYSLSCKSMTSDSSSNGIVPGGSTLNARRRRTRMRPKNRSIVNPNSVAHFYSPPLEQSKKIASRPGTFRERTFSQGLKLEPKTLISR